MNLRSVLHGGNGRRLRVRRGAAMVAAVGVAMLGGIAVASTASATADISICHRTASGHGGNQHNGYNAESVNSHSIFKADGHASHEQVSNGPGGDIIPEFDYGDGQHYDGLNLEWGKAWLDNGCSEPGAPDMGSLTLVKEVNNEAGGGAVPKDWMLYADNNVLHFSGQGGFTEAVEPGTTLGLSESDQEVPANYEAGSWVCVGATAVDGSLVTIGYEDVTCTITNTYVPPATQRVNLRLEKKVFNSEVPETSWTLRMATPGGRFLDGTTPFTHNVPMGTYKLSEFGGPTDGYTNEGWSCEAQGATVDVNSGDTVVIGAIDSVVAEVVPTVTCKITNTYKKPETGKPTLTLTKIVSGGSAVKKDWTLTATWQKPPKSETLSRQDSAKRDRDLSGAGSISGQVKPGFYTLSESPTVEPGPARYTAGAWKCEGGSLVGNVLELVKGDVAACTITNTYNPPFFPPPPPRADAPAISLVKIATLGDTNGDGFANAGESIVYTFSVTNTGNVALSDVTVIDALAGVGPVTCDATTLAVGATMGCLAAAFPVTALNATGAAIVNEATASGQPPVGARVSATASATTPTAVVAGEVVTAPVVIAPVKVVKGAVVTAAPDKVTALAFTGAETVPLGLSGLLTLLLGAGLVATARRQGRRANN